MNRRIFLKTSSAGALAAVSLPLLSFSNVEYQDNYITKDLFEKNGQEYKLSFLINPELLTNFDTISDNDKVIKIIATTSAGTSITTNYKAKNIAKKTIEDKKLNFISLRAQSSEMSSEEYKFAKDTFDKEIVLELHDKCHAVLRNEKLNLKINFAYKPKSGEAKEECFLTSACVFHKNLPDNCYELSTLRSLRENNMKPNPEYLELISEYEIIAPKMLLKINNASNKNEILDHIYSNLILPSISLIESGKHTEAIEYYGNYVNEMKKLYI